MAVTTGKEDRFGFDISIFWRPYRGCGTLLCLPLGQAGRDDSEKGAEYRDNEDGIVLVHDQRNCWDDPLYDNSEDGHHPESATPRLACWEAFEDINHQGDFAS